MTGQAFLIGTDASKFPGAAENGAAWMLDRAAQEGFEGVSFRSILDMSATLDPGALRELAEQARHLGLRIEAGAGKVNPFSTPEAPAIRALGGGDYLHAMTRMIEAAAEIGIHDIWSALCNYQFRLKSKGIFAFDRFRTDVDWDDQLSATVAFLHKLAPVLRHCGTHLNIETHEEITTFELVRIIETVGPDVLGITFDSANVLVRGEAPIEAARRAAPYVRATHIRDVALCEVPGGLARLLCPVGDGVIDWPMMLEALANPDRPLMLSIEGITSVRAEMGIPLFDPRWLAGHPDLTREELLAVLALERRYRDMVAEGTALGLTALRQPVPVEEALEFQRRSARALRDVREGAAHAA